MTKLKDRLIKLKACPEAVEWVGDMDLKTAWAKCERADWMLWFTERTRCKKALIVLATVTAIRPTVLRVSDTPVNRAALDAAEAWARHPSKKTEAAAGAASRDAAGAASWAASWAAELKIMAGLVRKIITVKDLGGHN